MAGTIMKGARSSMAERAWLFHFVTVAVVMSLSDASVLASLSGGSISTRSLKVPTAFKEASALLALRTSMSVIDQEWPSASDPCSTWKGVRCDNGHVVEVRLSGLARTSVAALQTPASIDALQELPFLRAFSASGFRLLCSLPASLGALVSLEVMDLRSTSLSGSIPSSFGQLSNLRILRLADNSLTGVIPWAIGNLSSLTLLDLSRNGLHGRIPETVGNLWRLEELNLSLNRLQGGLPPQLAGLSGLQRFLVSGNVLSGTIPAQLGSLLLLTYLDLSSNSLAGSIPADLGRLVHLTALHLENNELVGAIPSEITNCTQLQVLSLSRNGLTGTLPASLGKLRRMIALDLSSNYLFGKLPEDLVNLTEVESIKLANNLLHGSVPRSFSRLPKLAVLDLSGNYFSGTLPGNNHTNISVIMGRNCFRFSEVIGQRSRLDCGSFHLGTAFPLPSKQRMMAELLNTETSPSSSASRRRHLAAILAGVFAVIVLIILIAVLVFYILQYERKAEARKREKQAAVQRSAGSKPAGLRGLNIPSGRSINVTRLGEAFSYAQLQNATGQFDLSNMIMAGHTGDLYKGVVNGNVHVVVKRIEVSRFRKDLYVSELEFFGRVSHARLVPLLGHCLDREEEKFLVYKYMPNGDLAYALHRKDSPSRPEDVLQSLDWITRLKIAIGAAEGLVYLHHDCSPSLVHRDIKASSILLDDKYEVRLGSLTDARVQQGEHHSSIIGRLLRLSRSSDQLDAGPPVAVASCSYDVFCFGKVLLELVSGKLGISGSIDPGADAWLEWALPLIDIHDREPLIKLMDPSLIVDEDLMEEVWATAIIAKSCLNPKASRRPNMKHILRALENPQKVVRDDNSGPLKSRHSSYGSWNSALFGGWRHFSSESAFGYQGSLREEQLFEHHSRLPQPASGEDRYHRRPGSREIFPVPLAPTAPNQESEGTES